MITSTPLIKPRQQRCRERTKGFSLLEVIAASSLSAIVLAAILSAFLMIGRTSLAAAQYSQMAQQTYHAILVFGSDVRRATDVRWNSHQSVTLFVPATGNATRSVTYAYEPNAGGQVGSLYRLEDAAGSGVARQTLIQYVAPNFSFHRFKLEQSGVSDNTAQSDLETKQLRIALRATQPISVGSSVSQTAISAQFVLRNKRVSN